MQKDDCKLSKLAPEVQDAIEELARSCPVVDLVKYIAMPKAQRGFEVRVSVPTMYRFLRRRAEQRLKENAAEMKEAAGEMAAVGDRKEFRKGTMAMLQHRMYEEALTTGNADLVKEAYRMLSEEEAREVRLELEARRTAVSEENAKSARRKVELLKMNAAVALLPKLAAILTREGAAEGEILREARACLLGGGGELAGVLEAPGLPEKAAEGKEHAI